MHFVGVFPHEHAQCATWINSRTNAAAVLLQTGQVVLGKISIASTSQSATTDLPERSHQPGKDLIFPKR